MRRTSCLAAAASMLSMSAAVSCAPTSDAPNVAYGSTAPVGAWQATQSAESHDAGAAPAVSSAAGRGGVTPPSYMAGRAAPAAAGGGGVVVPVVPPSGGSSAGGTAASAAGSGGTVSSAAGSGGGGAPAVEPKTGVTSLSFQVTTSPAGGRYQPKNIGAIWIEDDSGTLIKTLQVWAGIRRRYLTGYFSALGSSAIDVTTTATLPYHQTHTVSWDLKDRSGAVVTPGNYRVRMELTDSDQTGRSNTVDFDASQPAQLTPADAPSFGAMKLTLQ